ERKIAHLTTQPQKVMMAAVLAGAYLTMIGLVYWTIQQQFAPNPLGKFLGAMFFGTGLAIIVFTKAELFTGNHLFMTLSTLSGKNSVKHGVYLWLLCWSGNLIGAILVAWLLSNANIFTGWSEAHALFVGAHHKMAMPASEIFFKGILANWIVCFALWVNLQLREELARFVAILLIIFIFVYLGLEHSIANMGTLAMACFADSHLPLAPMFSNLLWSSLGNIVGGCLGAGLPFWYLYRPSPEEG
ncbi:MAG: formate/nitrite transporter family protein, partial [Vampirovibrionales bacterium]